MCGSYRQKGIDIDNSVTLWCTCVIFCVFNAGKINKENSNYNRVPSSAGTESCIALKSWPLVPLHVSMRPNP